MKKILFIAFIFLSLSANAQGKAVIDTIGIVKVSESFWAFPDRIYLDSIEVDMDKTVLDVTNIKEIGIFNPKIKYFHPYDGPVLISRKVKNPFIPLSGFILEKDNIDSSIVHKFIIDGKFISDTSYFRIESTAIKSVEILKELDKKRIRESPSITYLIATKNSYWKMANKK